MKDIKVKWFGYMEPIDDDINKFLAMNDICEDDIVDIKYSVCYNGVLGSYPTALLIYRDNSFGIRIAKNTYDSLINFVNEYCVINNNILVKDRINLKDFKDRYYAWCSLNKVSFVKINHNIIRGVLKSRRYNG